MRTQDEVALGLLVGYRTGPRPKHIDAETKLMLVGCQATLEWLLGDETGPLAGTLHDLEKFIQTAKRAAENN